MSIEHEYLTPAEVSEIARKPIKSLAVDRCLRRDHPPYFKFGRKVLYKKSDVLAWLEAHRVNARGGA
jgi:predicted DNA-binding transcriptional regulator AlpA